jgi:hypothetical protein
MPLPARILATVLAGAVVVGGLIAVVDGWPGGGEPSLLIGFPDCEAPNGGLIGQPTAAWTSLTFVAVGIWIIGDRRLPLLRPRLLLALSIGAVGIGSFLGHAALTGWARSVDSLAIKLMLVAFGAVSLSRLRSWPESAVVATWAGLAAAVVSLELAWPASAQPLLVVLAVAGIALAWAIATPTTRRWLIGGTSLLAAAGAAWWLGGEGGPLCAPDAVFQLHGIWHILAAAGIASVYQIYRSETI